MLLFISFRNSARDTLNNSWSNNGKKKKKPTRKSLQIFPDNDQKRNSTVAGIEFHTKNQKKHFSSFKDIKVLE